MHSLVFSAFICIVSTDSMGAEQKLHFDHVAMPMESVAPEISADGIRAAEKIEAKGTITVKKDKRGMVEAVVFTDEAGKTYTIKTRGQGRMLTTADGKKIEVKGKAKAKGEETLLVVSSFKFLP